MPQDKLAWRQEYYTLIDDCEARESRLTEWEGTFLDSLRSQLDKGRSLSPKQTGTLDNIWQKATSKG